MTEPELRVLSVHPEGATSGCSRADGQRGEDCDCVLHQCSKQETGEGHHEDKEKQLQSSGSNYEDPSLGSLYVWRGPQPAGEGGRVNEGPVLHG